MEAPRVADAQSQLKLARCAVEHIYEALQAAEARAGEQLCRTQNATRRLVGDIEADAHGLRKLYVGQNNPHFQLKDRITPHVTNFFRLRLSRESEKGRGSMRVMEGRWWYVCRYVCR